MLGGWGGYEIVKISKAIYRYMESKKNLQFNDNFEIFILCFSVSHGAIEQLISFFSHFLVYHRERAREIVGLMARIGCSDFDFFSHFEV